MTAYVISEVEFLDRERVEIYRKLASDDASRLIGAPLISWRRALSEAD